MIDRCRRESHIGWAHYGGRGIKVCERWLGSYANFLADMGPRPGREYSIHRIDNDGDYEPGNCKWATMLEQMEHLKANHPHGMSPRQYERRLAANKRYRQRHPEKFRAYKKARRERLKALKTRRPAGVVTELDTNEAERSGLKTEQGTERAPGYEGSVESGEPALSGSGLKPGGAGERTNGTGEERRVTEWLARKRKERGVVVELKL